MMGSGALKREPKTEWVRRCELRLELAPVEPLRDLPLDPDPLSAFARQFESVRGVRGERADVVVDLLAASGGQRRRLRRQMAKSAHGQDFGRPIGPASRAAVGVGHFFGAMLAEGKVTTASVASNGSARTRKGSPTPVDWVGHRKETSQLNRKLLDADSMFELQVLLRVSAPQKERTKTLMQGLLSAFEIFAGDNEFRISGVRFFGAVLATANAPWRHRWFDYRFETGYFRPASPRGGNVVNAKEIEGLLKPFTAHCPERNVVRSGPYLSPAPRDMPRYHGQRGVLPLGMVVRDGKEVMVGMDMGEFFFGGLFGRSRFGKTELALCQLAHVAIAERLGAFFFDPAVTALPRIKPYLTEAGVRERVVEIDLSRGSLDARHVGWNLLSMQGLGEDRLSQRTNALVDAFSVGAGWTGRTAGRTTAILTAAIETLLTLSLKLPAKLQPTIFTIRRLMRDQAWRKAAIAHLTPSEAEFWTHSYNDYGPDARLPLAQLLSRLHSNRTVRATFGSPESTYDPRKAMDERRIVLAAPSHVSDHVSSLVMQGHIDAARSRADMAEEDLRRLLFFMFLDEAQTHDIPTGSRGSAIAELVEQCAKYGIRLWPMAQSPHRLNEHTIEALTTNASALITTATSPQSAKFFDSQWGGDVDARRAVQELARFHYIVGPTHRGRRVDPFRLRGVALEQLWGAHRHPESLPVLEQIMDATCRKNSVRQTLRDIEEHDDKILHALVNGDPHRPPRSRPPGSSRDEDAEIDAIPDGWGVKLRVVGPPKEDR